MLKIHETTDYAQFKLLERNRAVIPYELIESITKKNMLKEHPIICDKDLNIIDGQHRLKAAEMLGLSIYYIISDSVNEEDIGLCQTQKPWLMADFLKFYKHNNEDYQFVYDLCDEYGLPIHFLVSCCSLGATVLAGTGQHAMFRKGKFKLKKDKELIREKLNNITDIKKLTQQISKNAGVGILKITSRFLRALWSFVNKEGYDQERMLSAIEHFPANYLPILNFNSEKMIGDALKSRVYNFRRQIDLMQ